MQEVAGAKTERSKIGVSLLTWCLQDEFVMRQIIIGREGNQPFTITDEYVSRQHAVFTYDDASGLMTLTDKSRPNVGTFIRMGNQFQQISQCNVDATTDVRLGPYFTFRIGQLFQAPVNSTPSRPVQPAVPPKPKVEKADIAYLRKVAENYEETKLLLDQKQTTINGLKGLGLVGSLAGGSITAILPELLGSHELIYKLIGPIAAILFLVILMMYCSKVGKELLVKKNKNEKNYKITFCCPKCHMPFAGKLYENILAEGKCPKCKTEFYDSKI